MKTFTQQAIVEGIVGTFLMTSTLSDGRQAVWMGDHWMVTAQK